MIETKKIQKDELYNIKNSINNLDKVYPLESLEKLRNTLINSLKPIADNIRINIIDREEQLYTSQYIPIIQKRDNIINLGKEIQIDTITKSFINPSNGIEFNFNKLPVVLKIIISKLIDNLHIGCNINEFGGDVEDENKNDNKIRLKDGKQTRDFHTFLNDKVRNLKSIINRQLKTTKNIKFIKSTNKTWSLIIR